jgi:O-antigen/teichoic acid export membrane protein
VTGLRTDSEDVDTAERSAVGPPEAPRRAWGLRHGRHRRKQHDLADSASGALAWSFANTIVSRLGTIGIGIALARLLGPQQFGTYAVAYVALIAVLSFNELGVSLAIVRWPGNPDRIAPTVTTISVVSSAVLTGVAYFAAPAFSSALGDPGATSVVRLVSLNVLISGVVATPVALLQRDFQQGRRMMIDQINTWLGAIVSVSLAVSGVGAMSLAVGRLTGSLVSGVLFVALSPLPYRLGFDRTILKPLMKFGLPLAGASIVVFALSYSDQLVAGHMLGSVALGFYALAFNLSSWPVTIFSQPLRSVAPVVFSKLQGDVRTMRSSLRLLAGLVAAVTLPACLFISGSADPIVRFVYGNRWVPAASALGWLAAFACFKILFELLYDYLVVVGAAGSILVLQVVALATVIPALIIGARGWGISGVAAAQVADAAFVLLPLYLIGIRRVGIRPSELLRRMVVPAVTAAAVGGCGFVIARSALAPFESALVSGLIALAAIGGLLYRDRASVRQLREHLSMSVESAEATA